MMTPPKRPKNEPTKITIANQDRQIEWLCHRITELTDKVALHATASEEWRKRCHQVEIERDQLRKSANSAQSQIDYHRGYIARVKEGDRQMFGMEAMPPFPAGPSN